jgi:hypothetical protein
MRYLVFLGALAISGLSGSVVYLSRQNSRLHGTLAKVYASSEAAFSACLLPTLKGRTAAATNVSIQFPRQRPLLLLITFCLTSGSLLESYPQWRPGQACRPLGQRESGSFKDWCSAHDARIAHDHFLHVCQLFQPTLDFAAGRRDFDMKRRSGSNGHSIGLRSLAEKTLLAADERGSTPIELNKFSNSSHLRSSALIGG